MAPFSQTPSTPTDTRFLASRQIDELLNLKSEPLERRSSLEQDATSHEDLTLRLLLSRRTPAAAPDTLVTSSEDGAILESRQTVIRIIPTVYEGLDEGPAPGTVVGIVLGSVAGFLILIWLLWRISNGSGTVIRTTGDIEEIDVVRRRSRSPRARRTRSRRQEMSSRAASPRRVVRTERIVREFPDRSRSPSVIRDRSRVRETIIVEEARPERRFSGDDVVEVIEEHSELSPRRERRRRESGNYRSVTEERIRERVVETDGYGDEPLPGSYRVVDPEQRGGGRFKPHRVR